MSANRDEEIILFCTNRDGTVNCAWCDGVFNSDFALPDANLDPICPDCYAMAERDAEGYEDITEESNGE